jgi:dipicolinate synthase subunit B
MIMDMPVIGYALTGSFCTFRKSIEQMQILLDHGYHVLPMMSFNAASIDTRFGKAEDFRRELHARTNRKVICTIEDAEPIGPQKLCDLLVVSPCTGNTLAKLANGITDTPVTLAVKAHLRNERPVVIAVSTNDALASAGKNIGALLNYKNIYFVPMKQDDCINKPRSVVADFIKIPETVEAALLGRQIQPVIS